MSERKIGPVVTGFHQPPAPGETIAGRFVTLEPLDPVRHAEDLYEANRGHDWLWDYMGYGPFPDIAAYRAWQESVAGKPDPCFYALRDNATGKVGGLASFMRLDRPNGVIEIGNIQISPVLQRGPATSEAIMLMIRWAFEAGYRRVEWKCNALNEPSIVAARRYGFLYEGTFRQHLMVRGRNRDSAWFSIIDGEWPAVREAFDAWLSPENFAPDGSQRRRLSEMTAALRQSP
ncbi:GNAT family protein [Paracoccus sp. CPCC 101403]|uniref:GNAT family protein n=1 Tax=Paracoccus broussonetiae TaxID=3075834 RepID=A0ABU3EFM8_9RHOB|nr:GNAT family protein [Paracoccus sp. CPCC 101403]MDT1062916.1 GNAT family protein [Paracoccus sp. CPCC 101403]